MARGDASYARCWCDWPNDPRLLALRSPAAKWVNHCLWLLAVKERCEVLPAEWDVHALARFADVSPRTVGVSIEAMEAGPRPLVRQLQGGRIWVCGVAKAHTRITWKPWPSEVPLPDPCPTSAGEKADPYGSGNGQVRVAYGSPPTINRQNKLKSRQGPEPLRGKIGQLVNDLGNRIPSSAEDRGTWATALAKVLTQDGTARWEDELRLRALMLQAAGGGRCQRKKNPAGWLVGALSNPKFRPADSCVELAKAEMNGREGEKRSAESETVRLGEALANGEGVPK